MTWEPSPVTTDATTDQVVPAAPANRLAKTLGRRRSAAPIGRSDSHRGSRSNGGRVPARADVSDRPTSRPEVPPTVAVRPEVIAHICAASAQAGRHETGGPLIGLRLSSWEAREPSLIVAVLATVPPGPAGRSGRAWVALGGADDGERAAEALRWWRSVTDYDLVHVGDWHRHPGGLPAPSGGDRVTAATMLAESGAPIWLTAVSVGATAHRRGRPEANGHLARYRLSSAVAEEVGFYHVSGTSELVASPLRLDAAGLPGLPPLPWHVVDPSRYTAECRLLRSAGFAIEIGGFRCRQRLEVRLRLGRDGNPPLTVVTGMGYPYEAPLVLDHQGRRVGNGRSWSPGMFLVDVAEAAAS